MKRMSARTKEPNIQNKHINQYIQSNQPLPESTHQVIKPHLRHD
jgi:hypothetical protein